MGHRTHRRSHRLDSKAQVLGESMYQPSLRILHELERHLVQTGPAHRRMDSHVSLVPNDTSIGGEIKWN